MNKDKIRNIEDKEIPELGWSLHMTGGWQTQLERVKRWYTRITSARNRIDKLDYFYAFFENAFHLRDWLLNSEEFDKKMINQLFEKKVEMRLC